MTAYHFNKTMLTNNFEVMVDTGARYGYFEHLRLGDNCGGGLWFEPLEGGVLALVDYDGVFELPGEVKDSLTRAGFILDEEF